MDNQLILDSKPADILQLLKNTKLTPKDVSKKLWLEVIEEFKGKFLGSMLCYERMLRLNGDKNNVQYALVIVLKNSVEAKDFDFLQIHLVKKLKNLTGEIKILRTQDL